MKRDISRIKKGFWINMQCMGSKRRLAKYILPIILKDRKPGQWYIEPFVGGANMIDKVDGPRIGNDINYYLIEMWKAIQHGWIPPDRITEKQYKIIKNNQVKYHPALTCFAGFLCSFGGKWFGAPSDFRCVFEHELICPLDRNTKKKRVEKLYKYEI